MPTQQVNADTLLFDMDGVRCEDMRERQLIDHF